jgi:uncharacterized protein (DUF1501 family)
MDETSDPSAPPADPSAGLRLSRRGFLTLGGGIAVAGAIGGRLAWGSLVAEHVEQATTGAAPDTSNPAAPGSSLPAAAGRVLVIVQMSGGNDGLNTLIPAGDGAYFDARPTLQVKEADVLSLAGTDHYGFNPALRPLLPLWERKQLVALDAIGLPEQTRSHFAAMDAWWSATPGQTRRNGWVGRWLDRTGDPTNPLRAIALGGGSPALMGERAIATVVRDPATFTLRTPKGSSAEQIRDAFLATAAPLESDPTFAAAQASVPSALRAVDVLAQAARSGSGTGDDAAEAPSGKAGAASDVTDLLRTAAGIIDLDLGTQVILVDADGFDTHSDQARRQSELLADVATGIATFLDAVQAQGNGDRVLVMTTSEFGRRVHENGSGTDHGNGNVQFLAGPMVAGGQIVGAADLTHLDQGDLRASIDTRSLYANALDWLSGAGGPSDEVLGGPYDRYGLVRV